MWNRQRNESNGWMVSPFTLDKRQEIVNESESMEANLAQPLLPTLDGNDDDNSRVDEEVGGSLLGEDFLPPTARGKKPPPSHRINNNTQSKNSK